MKKFKIMMQVLLAVFFFGLLATSTVFADTTGGQFVDKDNRKYYIKDDHKAIYWHKIDGKMYYFDDDGEMVVGWQYLEIPGTGYRDDLFDNRPVFEIGLQYKWYYFDQDGVLQEFVGKQVLEAKTDTNIDKYHGEQYDSPAEKRVYYFEDQRSYHTLKTGWVYDDGQWYYLQKDGGFESRINSLKIGELARDWINDDSTWCYLDTTTGIMQTGWKHLGNKWYYLSSSGAMATGWVKDGSTWYYLNANNGDMKTGWFQVNGKWYYAYSSGALAVSTKVDGYYVNYNGEWVQ